MRKEDNWPKKGKETLTTDKCAPGMGGERVSNGAAGERKDRPNRKPDKESTLIRRDFTPPSALHQLLIRRQRQKKEDPLAMQKKWGCHHQRVPKKYKTPPQVSKIERPQLFRGVKSWGVLRKEIIRVLQIFLSGKRVVV